MLCKLVVVTALSSNHITESLDFFGSVYANFPSTRIIVYDLGLSENEVSRLQSYCNVLEVRKFEFSKYPPHTKDLLTYSWKPHVVYEVSKSYELFIYCDASCRFNKALIKHFPELHQYPLIPLVRGDYSILRTTHNGMLKYLAPNMERDQLLKLMPKNFFESGGVVYLSNKLLLT